MKNTSLSLAILLLLCLFPSCQDTPEPRPNILFAIADDWGWPHAGAYGDPVVQTPTFDRLAAEGLLFSHAYISAPSCTPSRNAILSGQYHWRLGPGANLWSTLDPATPVYPLLLADAGYHVGRFRKSWGPGDISNWPRHPAGTDYTDKGFKAFLDDRPEGQPFCFWLGSSDPHRPYDQGSGVAAGIDTAAIRLFECFPDVPEVRSDVADYYYEVQRFDSLVAEAIRLLEERGELENTIIVMTGDHGMPFPRCKANNYDSGARIPLAIRFGAHIKNPGRILEDFISTTDLAPTFLDLAGVPIPDVMSGKSLARMFPTGASGLVDSTRRHVLHGKERHVPGQEGHMGGYPIRALRTHDYLYIRNVEPERWPSGTPDYLKAAIPYCWLGDCDNGPTKTWMVEQKRRDSLHMHLWDLAFGKRPAEELYDCRSDPQQMHNVADDPDYARIMAEMSDLLEQELIRTEDPRFCGGPLVFDTVTYLGHGPRHPSFRP